MADNPRFADLLQRATSEPGSVSSAYQAFHSYSFGNQLLAWSQCLERELPLGPMATFPRWLELGRAVQKGQKALTLCMPITVKRREQADGDELGVFTAFVFKSRWFVLAQTAGDELAPTAVPGWDIRTALTALDIAEVPFADLDGNCAGYAKDRTIAINPVGTHVDTTRFHEVAHILLGHTAELTSPGGSRTPPAVRELEAEAVAMLCSDALGVGDASESRGYIQHWFGQGNPVPDKSAQRIFKVADQILKAGRSVEGGV